MVCAVDLDHRHHHHHYYYYYYYYYFSYHHLDLHLTKNLPNQNENNDGTQKVVSLIIYKVVNRPVFHPIRVV